MKSRLVLIGLAIFILLIVSSVNPPAVIRASQSFTIYLPLISKTLSTKGIAMAYNNCDDVLNMGIGWYYNYSSNPPNCASAESVAMAWGAANASSPMGGTSNWVMGFNEPNNPYGQSDLSPHDGAIAWHTFEINNPTRKLVSPGPYDGFSSPPLLTGANWLTQFRSEYISLYGQPPRLDALAVHCYWQVWDRGGQDCKTVFDSFQSLADSWGVGEIWITEFNFMISTPCNTTGSSWQANMDAMKIYLNSHPKYSRFAWFTNRIGDITECYWAPLFYNNGTLTTYGILYQGY